MSELENTKTFLQMCKKNPISTDPGTINLEREAYKRVWKYLEREENSPPTSYSLRIGDKVTAYGWVGQITEDDPDQDLPLKVELEAGEGRDAVSLHYRCTRSGRIDKWHFHPTVFFLEEANYAPQC